MEIRFNVTGSARKELVGIISQVTGCKQVYKGMPSAAYEVADITISKDGTVSYDKRTEESTIKAILEQTAATGFTAALDEAPATETPETPATAEADISAAAKDTGLVISFPADKVNIENLRKLLESKSDLIKKALEVEAFPIEEHDDQVSFPWWPSMPDFDAITAYTACVSLATRLLHPVSTRSTLQQQSLQLLGSKRVVHSASVMQPSTRFCWMPISYMLPSR